MSEFSKSNNEDSDSERKSSSESSTDSSAKARGIGRFASFRPEAMSPPPSRIEIPPLRAILETDKKDADDDSSEKDSGKSKKSEKVADTEEAKDLEKHHTTLKEAIAERKEKNQEVIDSTPPESPEHIEAVAAKEFEERVEARIDNPELEDPVIEAEYARRLEELEAAENTGTNEDDQEAEAIELELTDGTELNLETEEATAEDRDDEPATAATPAPTVSATTAASATSPSGTGNSSPAASSTGGAGSTPPPGPPPSPPASPPPRPPASPLGPLGGNVPPSTVMGRAFNAPSLNPNTVIVPGSSSERSKKVGAFLTGGILGYMIGRRGGRKRAERRLQPEISALENNLETTTRHLAARERDLKTAAANRLREIQAEKHKLPIERMAPKSASEVLRQATKTTSPETIPSVPPAKSERLTTLPPLPELPKPIIEAQPKRELQKHVEQLSTEQLLKQAETLFIEGTSVRKLYETNQIDRRGLVEIVREGLRGGNIVHTFEEVELGKERQAERAREFRHDDPSFSALGSQTSDDSSQVLPPLSAPQLPNNPDANSLQPLSSALESSTQNEPSQSVQSRTQNPLQKINPKTAEFKFAAIAAIAIAVLILWAIIS